MKSFLTYLIQTYSSLVAVESSVDWEIGHQSLPSPDVLGEWRFNGAKGGLRTSLVGRQNLRLMKTLPTIL